MRHLLSVLLASISALIIYVFSGFAVMWFSEATVRADTDIAKAALGLVAALVAGALYAPLVMARLSPLGPFWPG